MEDGFWFPDDPFPYNGNAAEQNHAAERRRNCYWRLHIRQGDGEKREILAFGNAYEVQMFQDWLVYCKAEILSCELLEGNPAIHRGIVTLGTAICDILTQERCIYDWHQRLWKLRSAFASQGRYGASH